MRSSMIGASSSPLRRVVAILAATLALAASLGATATAQPEEDLRSYYPNPQIVEAGNYLEGYNYDSGSPQRSVLWFELGEKGKFKQYNSAPDDPNTKCHYDKLRWKKGVLRYSKTHDSCGDVTSETKFSPAIQLMPRQWAPGDKWRKSGRSEVKYKENGEEVCKGINNWEASVQGWVDIAPGVPAIHVRSRQTTRWTEGQSASGCSAGYTTNWEENYYLLPDMSVVGGGTANAFKRSVGGNSDIDSGGWDVWFDTWSPLPG